MSVEPGPWRPILSGELADRVNRSIEEIVAAFPAAPSVSPYPGERTGETPALAGGNAGHALFYSYLAEATGREEYAEAAERHLDEAVEALATEPMGASLYGGFSGVAWVAEHLQGRLYESEEGEDANEEIDTALAELLDHPWSETYDLIGGLVGFGVYALERVHRPTARLCLERTVERFSDLAEKRDNGHVTWFTPPEQLPEHQLEVSPNGYYNLGVAHGVPGVIPVLAGAVAAGIESARPLVEGAVDWLLASQLPAGLGSRFGYTVSPGVDVQSPSRLAWCYGDLGLAAALFAAARTLGRKDWEEEALSIARDCTGHPDDAAGARDAGLCHGGVGIAHIYNRLYQASGDEKLGAAAEHWYAKALELREPGEGIAGYRSYFGGFKNGPEWLASKGFLEGAAGIGLGLLAGVSSVEPAWDRVLCISLPPVD
ncbi:MAG TPA: lanthionine synthetase C family protein [Thermoanaerobaculia bacterium]|jgi:lantibiotic modifying enzyme|nr:lanthionine synthetase C family protein [Thermoanaerobaculia bacterium]